MAHTNKPEKVAKADWIRFQLSADHRVLEGFVQEISPDGTRVRVGRSPDSKEYQWHALGGLSILKKQTPGAPA